MFAQQCRYVRLYVGVCQPVCVGAPVSVFRMSVCQSVRKDERMLKGRECGYREGDKYTGLPGLNLPLDWPHLWNTS